MIRALALALALMGAAPPPAVAQDWGDIGALMIQHLTRSQTAEASVWLPNSPDPAAATIGLGVVYEWIRGSAGNTTIAVGFFVRQGAGWAFAGEVQGLYGHEPRAPYFTPSHAELTTTMPGPDDPRCCPTVPTRWRIDYQTLHATALR